eukprot:TRINITY_DN4397_c0_g1_i1.p1 TRINITY_DN4397_c0_g1~~TRINITY_DN4397_c0_g1_i1.p1  ORF type:complete len:233 (+),score=66.36 TRINITY_DN4397_c0_g1_i1:128-826(+)
MLLLLPLVSKYTEHKLVCQLMSPRTTLLHLIAKVCCVSNSATLTTVLCLHTTQVISTEYANILKIGQRAPADPKSKEGGPDTKRTTFKRGTGKERSARKSSASMRDSNDEEEEEEERRHSSSDREEEEQQHHNNNSKSDEEREQEEEGEGGGDGGLGRRDVDMTPRKGKRKKGEDIAAASAAEESSGTRERTATANTSTRTTTTTRHTAERDVERPAKRKRVAAPRRTPKPK